MLCEDFKHVPPRPTIDHRLFIVFPADEDKPRFVWLPQKDKHKHIKSLVTNKDLEIKRSERFDARFIHNPVDDGLNWREIATYHIANQSHGASLRANLSLSKAVLGDRFMETMRGTIVVEAIMYVSADDWDVQDRDGKYQYEDDELEQDYNVELPDALASDELSGYHLADVMRGDIDRLLHYFERQERKHRLSLLSDF